MIKKGFSFLSTYFAHFNLHTADSNFRMFELEDIKTVTNNFSDGMIIRKDGSGKTYQGLLDGKRTFAVTLLNLDIIQGSKEEWLAGVMYFGQLEHPHLVTLVGYCCDDKHRILVHQHNLGQSFYRAHTAVKWTERLKIASGVAKGLAFLLGTDKPSIAVNCIDISNILVDSSKNYKSQLIHFKPLIDGRVGNETQVSREDILPGQGHSVVADALYGFGKVLLEILTGSPVTSYPNGSDSGEILIDCDGQIIKNTHDIICAMDSKLKGQYSDKSAKIAATLASKCLGQYLNKRHTIGSVIEELKLLRKLDSAYRSSPRKPVHRERHGDKRSKKTCPQ